MDSFDRSARPANPQFSASGAFDGLANNLRKPAREAAETDAARNRRLDREKGQGWYPLFCQCANNAT